MSMALDTQNKIKSFWDRPEGTTGKAVLAMLGIGAVVGVYFIYAFLPIVLAFVTTLLANVLYAGFLGAAILALVGAVMSPAVRAGVGITYKVLMRQLTQIWKVLDPIAVIEEYIQTMKKNVEKMAEQISNLRKTMGNLQRVVDQNEKEKVNCMRLAKVAKPRDPEFRLQMNNVGRLEKSNEPLKALYAQLDLAYRTLCKMQEIAETLIKDFSSEVTVQKRQREALRSGASAFRSAMRVIKNDPEQKYILDSAMETVATEIGEKLGEMEHFMEISAAVIHSADLQNAVDQEAGLKMLEEWSKSPSLLLGSEKAVLVSASSVEPAAPLKMLSDRSGSNSESSKSTYKDLIENH